MTHDASLDWLLRKALARPDLGRALRDARHSALDRHRLLLQPVADRRGDRRRRGHAQGAAAALQPPGKPLHLARHHHAEAEGHGDDALNAFASGLNEKQYSITVTSGLLEHLDDDEIEAVLGHELTHIRNGDVRMLVIAVIIAGVIGFFAELVFRMMFQGGLRWRRRPLLRRQRSRQGRRRRCHHHRASRWSRWRGCCRW